MFIYPLIHESCLFLKYTLYCNAVLFEYVAGKQVSTSWFLCITRVWQVNLRRKWDNRMSMSMSVGIFKIYVWVKEARTFITESQIACWCYMYKCSSCVVVLQRSSPVHHYSQISTQEWITFVQENFELLWRWFRTWSVWTNSCTIPDNENWCMIQDFCNSFGCGFMTIWNISCKNWTWPVDVCYSET